MTEHSSGIQMLKLEDVASLVRFKKSTIYDWMNKNSPRYKPHFPLPRKSGRTNRWFESEINEFCAIEYGNSNAAVKGGCPVDSDASNIPPASQRKAIKAIGKGALPPGKPEMTPTSPLECPASVKQNTDPLESPRVL